MYELLITSAVEFLIMFSQLSIIIAQIQLIKEKLEKTQDFLYNGI